MKRRLAMVPTLAALLLLTAVAPGWALDEADRLYMVGERALADRFFPVARRALERFVAQYPSDPRHARAQLMLGKSRLALNDGQAALEALTRAGSGLTAPAEQAEVKLWQAEAQFRLKRYAEARAAYDDVVKADATSPLAPDALYGRARSDLELKRPEPAVAALRDLLTTWPDHALAPAATYQQARALVELKRVDEAQALLGTFPGKYPSSKLIPDAQYLLGWVKMKSGDPRGGVADLKSFVAAYPNHEEAPAARTLIAQAAGKYGDRNEQAEAYKTLMAENPPTPDGLSRAVEIATHLSRPKDADAAWHKLRTEFPDHPSTRQIAFTKAQAAFKQKNYKDAGALAQTAALSDDESTRVEALLILGESELKLKRFPQAAKAFEAVGAISTVDAGARFRALAGLGLAREEQKEWKAALTAYEAVAARSPDATLRDWAKERAAAMRQMVSKSPSSTTPPKKPDTTKPSDKPAGKKS
ncbi:MAG TPA: tetratricopeptide repeat protein [Methylomirabilota bacterium]|jgi:TolA-binding protein|nr:tetratricopeptide repeat protein [Methylomirabilota bacterium]